MANRNDFSRADRVRKAIIREFSDILTHEVKDPKLVNQLISVTDVEVSGDMRHAKVFVSIMGEETLQNEIMDVLKENTPKIRSAIGQRIRLRYTPEIDVRLDNSLERGARVTQLLNQISRGEV
ncbi:MAG: ribosome-binding factor [Vampirovibrio sp.]|jgi:ribosome-binding factor A|nr:ribosome-binding factor [Vampirovibrio sp.]